MKRNNFLIVILIFLFTLNTLRIWSLNKINDYYSILAGVWFDENDGDFKSFNSIENSTYDQTFIDNFSWGKSVNIAYRTMVIDYKDSNLTFLKGPGYFRIKSIDQKEKNVFNVIIYFYSEDIPENLIEYYNMVITINDRRMIIDGNVRLFKGKYFKIGGPGMPLFDNKIIKYYKTTIDNLRFRELPDLNGKFIRSLFKGEKLELIEKGKEKTINGAKGTWVKVKTEKGEIGWCFDAYLEEVK